MNDDLDLGLDSSKELFDIIITPLKTSSKDMKELTLDDYIQLREFEYDPSIHFFECLSCSYGGYGYGDFKRHKCKNHGRRFEENYTIK